MVCAKQQAEDVRTAGGMLGFIACQVQGRAAVVVCDRAQCAVLQQQLYSCCASCQGEVEGGKGGYNEVGQSKERVQIYDK